MTGASLRDRATRPADQAPSGLGDAASVPSAQRFPDWRPIFQARRDPLSPCAWEVWDIEHPAECNHFPIVRVDSNGADDLHQCIAKMIADCMNTRWAAEANKHRREEASAIEARSDATPQSGAAEGESATRKGDAQ